MLKYHQQWTLVVCNTGCPKFEFFCVSWIFILSSDTGGNKPRAMLWFPAIAECGCNWMDGLSNPHISSLDLLHFFIGPIISGNWSYMIWLHMSMPAP